MKRVYATLAVVASMFLAGCASHADKAAGGSDRSARVTAGGYTQRRLSAQSEADRAREKRTIDTRRRASGSELAHAYFPILESGSLSVLGKFHRTSETAYEQRSALPNRVMPAATRLTQFAAVSDLACRCGNSQQTMDELAPHS